MWREFVQLAEKHDEPFAALCARFGISRKTGYKWLNRFRRSGEDGLKELSRRPKNIPRKTPDFIVEEVLALRRAHPDWTAARIRESLVSESVGRLPGLSTISLILKRRRQTASEEELRREPNYRWVLEEAELGSADDEGAPLLTIVRDETTDYVLEGALFCRRGETQLADWLKKIVARNGSPLRLSLPRAAALKSQAPCRAFDASAVWLAQNGVAVEFRFAEEFAAGEAGVGELDRRLASLPDYQRALLRKEPEPDALLRRLARELGNAAPERRQSELERLIEAHNFAGRQEALQRSSPLVRYRPGELRRSPPSESLGTTPETEDRLVSEKGIFSFQRRLIHAGRAFSGRTVEVVPAEAESFGVFYAGHYLGAFSLSGTEQDDTTSLQLTV